jgi:hypothetical protein
LRIACIGTGPSLTPSQVEAVRRRGYALYGCNLTYQIVPDLAVLFATNGPFWDYYWNRDDGPRNHPVAKWTNDQDAAGRYGLNYIGSREGVGLSENPRRLHHGHSSGFCLLNLAYLHGATSIVLIGYDLKYAPDYVAKERKVGSSPRHYFGEYPSALQHWPSLKVRGGVHVELVEKYREVARQGLVEILNATPGSAIDCFPRVTL